MAQSRSNKSINGITENHIYIIIILLIVIAGLMIYSVASKSAIQMGRQPSNQNNLVGSGKFH